MSSRLSVPETDTAFEVIEAMPGFCKLTKRSGTLDGNLPLRAAQHCMPVVEGSAAGFQIELLQPITLARGRTRRVVMDMTPVAYQQTEEQAPKVLQDLLKRGLLKPGGHWEKLFQKSAIPMSGTRVRFWTGHLVRPRPGYWLFISGAFNRRSRVRVIEHAVCDPNGWVPLTLEIDGSALGRESLWIENEIACVMPIVPGMDISLSRLEGSLDAGRRFCEFYDASYFQQKPLHPTGRYRKLLSGAPKTIADQGTSLFTFAGPATHSIVSIDRFATPNGFARKPGDGLSMKYVLVRNIARIKAEWDGQCFMESETRIPEREITRLKALFLKHYGEEALQNACEFLERYFYTQKRDDPTFLIAPWAFMATPSGWWSLLDGYHGDKYDGMRGVIATDIFQGLGMVYRLYGPCRISLQVGAPLMRIMPVPRNVLRVSYATQSL